MRFIIGLLILATSLVSFADDYFSQSSTKSPENDSLKLRQYQLRCEYLKALVVKGQYPVDCFTNYHHYGAVVKRRVNKAHVKIANYNLLHPGTSKALYKDYSLVAKIMNNFDVVSGLELLNTVGRDEQNNKTIIEYIHSKPDEIRKLYQLKETTTAPKQIEQIDAKIAQLTETTNKAYELFRAPGYLKILEELKKLDPSWSLILSPRGDSALAGSVEEFIGYYYRATTATPSVNPHCNEFQAQGHGTPVACFIDLTYKFMNVDLYDHFARRPFMATFSINKKPVHLIASHVVFTYSGDESKELDMMRKVFGVNSHKDLPTGINSANFARFAEVKTTLDFMWRFSHRYNDNKIMFMGDMNLNSNNNFWSEVLKSFPGSSLLINQPTTLSPVKTLVSGKETNGVANDYDHFILNRETFSMCSSGDIYNYYEAPVYTELKNKYLIRDEENLRQLASPYEYRSEFVSYENHDEQIIEGDLPPIDDQTNVPLEYPLTPKGQSKMDKSTHQYEKRIMQEFTIKRDQVVLDDYLFTDRVEGYRRRVFLRQLTNRYYYRFVQELLSDHFPVYITCKF